MPTQATARSDAQGDVLVILGIAGDLARVKTFRSLYRLEGRGEIRWPIIGVVGGGRTLERPDAVEGLERIG